MGAVFISYRPGDADGPVRALVGKLTQLAGKRAVLIDADSIAPGREFREVLKERLESCDVMLALIGKGWLHALDASGHRRLEDANDVVRQEISTALKRNIAVTPVLLEGAGMPAVEYLPGDLKNLVLRNSFELTRARWDSDVNELMKRLRLRKSRKWYWIAGVVVLLIAIGSAFAFWPFLSERIFLPR